MKFKEKDRVKASWCELVGTIHRIEWHLMYITWDNIPGEFPYNLNELSKPFNIIKINSHSHPQTNLFK